MIVSFFGNGRLLNGIIKQKDGARMKLYLVVGHERGMYEEDYNLIGIYDNETLSRSTADKDTDFDTYEIQTCILNERIVYNG